MDKEATRARLVALFLLFLLAVGVYLLWSHNQEMITRTAAEPMKYVAAKVRTVKKARSLKVAFDNPRMGYCPVCNEPVNHQSFATIRGKNYALCSDQCVEELQTNPTKYLTAAGQP